MSNRFENFDEEFQDKIKETSFDQDLWSMLEAGIKSQEQKDLNIIEFVDEILTGFNMKMFLSQRVILKAIYCLPLDNTEVDEKFGLTERQLMDKWVREQKCNWRDPAELLPLFNQRVDEHNLTATEFEKRKHITEWKFTELIIEAGMRSSKTTMAAIVTAYEFYRLTRMDNPQAYFNLPRTSLIFMTVMATTAGQGENTVYGNVRSMIENSDYFKEEIKSGRILVGAESIKCPGKNITISLGHSKATSIVGRSAPLVVFDEIAMFGVDDNQSVNAAEIYARVGRSAATFQDKAKRIAISSAKVKGDYMEQLVRDNFDNVVEGTLVFSLTTFDVNPIMNMDNPIIRTDYNRDPEQALRDYENVRPMSISTFIPPHVVDRCITHDPMTYCHYQVEQSSDELNGEVRTYVSLDLSDIKRPEGASTIYVHCDPGVRKDSFGVVIGHPEYTSRGVETVIDLILEWTPRNRGRAGVVEVNLDNVEENLIYLNKFMKFTHITFDQWESHGSIQRLFRAGIPTFKQQFARNNQLDMYKSLRQRMKDGLVKIPSHLTLIEELKSLELANSGKSIQHPKNKDSAVQGRGKISKDLADGVAMVNWYISMKEANYDRISGFGNLSGAGAGNIIKRIGTTRASQIGKDWS